MGFFDNLFGGGVQAEASHILISGDDADSKLEDIKQNIYKTALKGKSADMGVEPEALMSSFAQQARKFSTCPSGQKGGSLGCFGKGQMVPEFDKVVFNDQVGVVHGPIQTQFGSHLILITDRDE